jgi:crossover junction endodeoxyribonuclease RuvC
MFGQAHAPIASAPRIVLGVDPGLTRCGYAVLAMNSAQDISALAIGVLRTPVKSPLPDRLAEIHAEIEDLLAQFRPTSVAIEQVFFQNNVSTAMSVGQASGIVLALASRAGCEVAQYTPSQVKNTVAGWGGATKEQVGRMVQQRLRLASIPEPADAADAAAIALCHCSIAPFTASVNTALAQGAS